MSFSHTDCAVRTGFWFNGMDTAYMVTPGAPMFGSSDTSSMVCESDR